MHTITIWLVSKKTLLTDKSLYSTQEEELSSQQSDAPVYSVSQWQPAKRRKLETPVQGDMEEGSADHLAKELQVTKNQNEEKMWKGSTGPILLQLSPPLCALSRIAKLGRKG